MQERGMIAKTGYEQVQKDKFSAFLDCKVVEVLTLHPLPKDIERAEAESILKELKELSSTAHIASMVGNQQ